MHARRPHRRGVRLRHGRDRPTSCTTACAPAAATRLTVAGDLGLPQVLVPGGAEHIGLFVTPHVVPERWRTHEHVFHNAVILAPRLSGDELRQVAREARKRLAPRAATRS